MFEDLPQGWMSDEELTELQRLAKGKTVLEVGTWKGRSAIAMAQVAERVFCVDHFRGDESTGKAWTLPELLHCATALGVMNRVHPIVCEWQIALPMLKHPFGFCLYDADHSEDSTFRAGSMLLSENPNKIPVAFHDYLGWHSVKLAVDALATRYARSLRIVGTLAILE